MPKFRRKMDRRFMYYLYIAFVVGFVTNITITSLSTIDYSKKKVNNKIKIYKGSKDVERD